MIILEMTIEHANEIATEMIGEKKSVVAREVVKGNEEIEVATEIVIEDAQKAGNGDFYIPLQFLLESEIVIVDVIVHQRGDAGSFSISCFLCVSLGYC